MTSFLWPRCGKMRSSLAGDSTLSLQVGALKWSCLSGYHTRLLGPDAPDWSCLDGDSRAVLVKANPLRRVYHVKFRDLDLYAKVYRPNSLGDHLKWRLMPFPSQMEFFHLQQARARAVPAAQPLAWAHGCPSRHPIAILLTASLGPTTTLMEVLKKTPVLGKNQLELCITAAAGLIAKLHCAGIRHRDLHAGNILFNITDSSQAPAAVSAFIADLQNVRIEQRSGHAWADPNRSWRIAGLAMLWVGLRIRLEKEMLDRFVRAYLQAVQPHHKWFEDELEEFFRRLNQLADRHERELLISRDRRSLRDSKYSKYIKLDSGWSARVYLQSKHTPFDSVACHQQFTSEQWQSALSEPLSLIRSGEILKKGGHNTVVAGNLRIGNKDLQVVAKHSRLREGFRGYGQSVRRSRALRQWAWAHALVNRRLPTAWPLAAIEHRPGLLLRESILLCERIPNSLSLRKMILQNALPKETAPRRALTQQLAELLAEIRRTGFRHRDCKANNILIQHCAEREPAYRAYLIDLDGLSYRRAAVNGVGHEALIRLGASVVSQPNLNRTDFARFFRCYIRYLDLPEVGNRKCRHKLWEKIAKAIQKRSEPDLIRKKQIYSLT